ncbi:hypothetical protein FEM48_Zijuj04G0131900 [Ziziphus jujuba var. spinosa]|uniref:Uncharacterized protein n=1 Tax=Ziziphus jujuba var. spinosa TaxID=714518 RepID=A0A978VK32_ZIZJJ|nr:hypothetical protein FEM48_Zijuj04G0131900 [Ziziphus jujuba var. spinosa]
MAPSHLAIRCTVDFNLPQCFDMSYIDSNSGKKKEKKKRHIMIHKAILRSLERFFGVPIEQYTRDFPTWLSALQARVLLLLIPRLENCHEVAKKLKANGTGAEVCHG